MGDFTKVINEMRGRSKSDKKRVTLWISSKVYAEFRKLCSDDVSPSKVVEAWMAQAVAEAKGKK